MTTKLYNLSHLKETRRFLRKNMTDAEQVLWSILKGKKIHGLKFRRQYSIGYYIVDFYCPSKKIVIELDSHHHFNPDGIINDKERDEHLHLLGFKVLRFENNEVLHDLTGVIIKIKSHLK